MLANPDIKILITDYNMPRMDGFELVKTIRGKYEKTDLVIIGLSSDEDGSLSARFIKNGANDFLRKPFNHEEFFCSFVAMFVKWPHFNTGQSIYFPRHS